MVHATYTQEHVGKAAGVNVVRKQYHEGIMLSGFVSFTPLLGPY